MGGQRKRQKLHVVKVPGNYNLEFRAPNWNDMPLLYLELLENKDKVKPECRNMDYEPSGYDMNSFPNFAQARISALEETRKDIEGGDDYIPSNNLQIPTYQSYNPQLIQKPIQNISQSIPQIQILTPKPNSPKIVLHHEEQSFNEIQNQMVNNLNSNTVSLSAALSNNPPPPIIQPKVVVQTETVNSNSNSYSNSNSNSDYLYNSEPSFSNDQSSSYPKEIKKEEEEDSSILSILRGNIDGKDGNERSILESTMASIPQMNYTYPPPSPPKNNVLNNNPLHNNGSIPMQQQQQKLYPSLSEINSGNIRPGNRDLTFLNKNDEKEIQRKRELLFKFKTLKRHYTDANIPEFTELSDLNSMEREYDTLVRQLRIDSNVENYKKYLIVGFGLVEFVLSKFLKFSDIEGFTQQQLLGMNQYEKILLEIGEKHQIEPSKQWSPELRLVGIIAMNAVIFVGPKMLFKSASSSDILNLITTPSNNKQNKSNPSSTPAPKTAPSNNKQKTNSMSGPNIDPEDLE